MSELHSAVADELAAYQPERTPPFATVRARKRSMDRTRLAAAGLVGCAALGGAAVVAGAGGLPHREGHGGVATGGPVAASYAIFADQATDPAMAAEAARCTTQTGLTVRFHERSRYVVQAAEQEQAVALERCLSALGGIGVNTLNPAAVDTEILILRCIGPESPADEASFYGLTEQQAVAKNSGHPTRVIGRDGECISHDADRVPDRLNLVLQDGKTVWSGLF